ncbi:MBL fold metallo-hydrolase [Actinomycetospora endophytica]|uniref:MBL fold metallo-hydrolase n=1 Tax=Actinomycetospora endophytica TaxID=2291215 RepID=A0ABS8P6H6_9PSEU|nr:MBL fold metallo-hydrolase [Actinomycetospora endophytica]MCD2193859.1 MBL fold metallo-hydrolase [Actinomycetospora endophytica]
MTDADDRHSWSRPEPETVAPDVLRVPLPLPLDALRAVNVYVLRDGDRLTLVDGGWALTESRDLLATALRGLGAELPDIGRFLVTHVHRDHYTQAVALRRETGAVVALGAGERDSLDAMARQPMPLSAQVAGLRRAGGGALADELVAWLADSEGERLADFAAPDQWLADGDRVTVGERVLEAVETPGHTRGHLVFDSGAGPDDEGPGLLFAGDHVLPHITPSIGFEPGARPGSLTRFLASLARVRERPDRRLLPAHGPVRPSAHARVDELLDHHGARLDAIERVAAAGAGTAAEAAAALTWTRREKGLEDLEPFHRMLAVLETDAHLEVLAAQGRVVREADTDGTYRNRPA